MVLLANVIVSQIQIHLFCDLNTGVTQDLAECEQIHSIHQTSLGEVVAQTVGTVFFIQTNPVDVSLKVGFKVVDIDVTSMILHREKVLTFHISIFELKPATQSHFSFGGEVHSPVLSSFGFFCSEIDSLSGKLQICDQQGRAFAQSHTTVQHEDGHNIIPVFCEIGFVKFTEQLSQIFVSQEHLCFAIVP